MLQDLLHFSVCMDVLIKEGFVHVVAVHGRDAKQCCNGAEVYGWAKTTLTTIWLQLVTMKYYDARR